MTHGATTDHWSAANVVARFFNAVDGRDWDRVASFMRTPVHIDYSSFGGGHHADRSPADVVDGWRSVLPGFDHTHHQLGNLQVVVEGVEAAVEAYVTATHVIGAEVWTVVGRYEIRLIRAEAGWRVSSLRFLFKYQTGATELPEAATRRARAKENA